MRYILPEAKKPMERLSGDQKGKSAFSVPARGCASVLSSGRSHNWRLPSPDATKAMRRPFGESAKASGAGVEGVLISTRISGDAGGGVSRKCTKPNVSAMIVVETATIHARTADA